MLQQLEQLHRLTVQAATGHSETLPATIDSLLALRDEVLAGLSVQSVVSEEQKSLLRQIASYDAAVLERMETFKLDTSRALEKLNQSKVQKSSYEQSYDVGSYFIDKKK